MGCSLWVFKGQVSDKKGGASNSVVARTLRTVSGLVLPFFRLDLEG